MKGKNAWIAIGHWQNTVLLFQWLIVDLYASMHDRKNIIYISIEYTWIDRALTPICMNHYTLDVKEPLLMTIKYLSS